LEVLNDLQGGLGDHEVQHRKSSSKIFPCDFTDYNMQDTWDMTKGYFHKCEKPRSGPDAPEDPFDMGCVAPIVMVTPVRRAAGPATYVEQIQNLHKLCKCQETGSTRDAN
jgi:hypothetical protein